MMRWVPAILALVIHALVTTMLVIQAVPQGQTIIHPPEKTELPAKIWSFRTTAVDDLIAELKAGQEKLDADRKDVLAMQGRVAGERAELEKVRDEIKAIRDEIDAKVVSIEEDEMKNLKGLAQTYSLMAPTAAVAIFREMDENMAVKVLALMKADKIGPIMAEMAKAPDKAGEDPMPKRAARIADKLRVMKPIKKTASS